MVRFMRLSHLLFLSIIFISSLTGIVYIQKKEIATISDNPTRDYSKEVQLNKLNLTLQRKIPRFGFQNMWANWNYLQFISYFGDVPARKETGYELISDYFKSIVKDDPRFISALLILATTNSVYAANPETTVKLLQESINQVEPELSPFTPYLWSYKGVDEMLFFGDIKSAQHSFEMASQWASKTEVRGAETLSQRFQETANFLATNPDPKKAKVLGWTFILNNNLDETTQKIAIREITSLGGKVTKIPEGVFRVEFPE